MASSESKSTKRKPDAGPAYLTKRRLNSAARAAVAKAAKETMELMGYNVIALNGWVIKNLRMGG